MIRFVPNLMNHSPLSFLSDLPSINSRLTSQFIVTKDRLKSSLWGSACIPAQGAWSDGILFFSGSLFNSVSLDTEHH